MASSPRCSSSSQLVALFFIFLVARPAVGDPATQQRINKICYQMEDYGFCNKTFNDSLRGRAADNVYLAQIANDQALRSATDTLAFIERLLPHVQDEALRNALQTCDNGFGIVKKALADGSNYFRQRDYSGMVNAERIAPRAQSSCGVIFDVPPVKENPLKERNREARILIAMSLVTAYQLMG